MMDRLTDLGASLSAWLARPVVRSSLGALAATLVLAVVYGALVLTETGQRLENGALRGAELRSEAERAGSLEQLAGISVVSFSIVLLAVAAVGVARDRFALAVAAVAVMGGSAVVAELLEALLPRPALVDGPVWLLRNTFPSGHAAVATAIGVGALLVAPERGRWLVLVAAALYAAVIGYAVQIAGWHRMSGVVGGTLVVIAIALTALAILARMGYVATATLATERERARTALADFGAVLIGAGLLILVLAAAVPMLRAPRGADAAFLHASFSLLGAGSTILAFAAFDRLIRGFDLGKPPPRAEP